MPEMEELLRQALFEMDPDSIFRMWISARVKAVGHNAQTPEEHDFVVVQELDWKMRHQGFEPMFIGDYGSKLPGVLEVLERVGATETVRLLQEAMDLLAKPFPMDKKTRSRIWGKKMGPVKKKSDWELDMEGLQEEYSDMEESCVDLAAKVAVEAYLKRGMPVPPTLPKRRRKRGEVTHE